MQSETVGSHRRIVLKKNKNIMIFYFGFGVLLQGAGTFLVSLCFGNALHMSLHLIMSILYVESGHEQIPYCKTVGMKYLTQYAKNNTTPETVDFNKLKCMGAFAAIHSLPGICTIHCKKGLPIFPIPSRLFPARESLFNDIPAGDGKIGNLFYSVYAVRVHAPSSKN
jgi:hypothetical protein